MYNHPSGRTHALSPFMPKVWGSNPPCPKRFPIISKLFKTFSKLFFQYNFHNAYRFQATRVAYMLLFSPFKPMS